jgi:tetratricopeptide (TPR) repeat protein
LVAQTRTLLVLDGLESLQEATGELREQGMKALLRQLGNEDSQGLCLITSRIPFRDVTYADSAAVVHHHLGVLPSDAAVELLKDKGVKGTDTAFDQVVADLQGHALSLTLFGNLLVELYGGDLGKRRKLPPIVRENPVRSVMGFYESRFKDKPELLFLYLMGLFDRAMFMPTLKALLKSAKKRWQMPALRGSYEAVFAPLMRLDDAGLRRLLAHLKKLELLVDAQPSKADLPSGQSLEARAYDCHPLIHEYFAQRFKQQWPTAWRQAHERLYHYYQSLPEKTCPDTLDELEPLFVAVTHGCQAGKPQQALDEVYLPRIRRDDEAYLSSVLGAIPMSLAVLSNFFASPWAEPLPQLGDESKAKVLGWAGFRLRALGRLETAKKPLALSLAMYEGWRDWQGAAEAASDLASLYLVLGQISTAFGYAQTAVRYADDLGDLREQSMRRTTLADVCHQMGKLEDAERYFGEAEAIHSDNPGEGCRFLHGLWGFRHCDLLLTQGRWREVLERAGEVQKVNHGKQKKLDMALNKLMFGRAYLAQAQASGSTEQAVIQQARESIYAAVEDLRAANENHHLPKGFLACAQLHRLLQDHVSAAGNLASAKAISTRRQGNMRLYLTDYHLESARLALDLKQMSRVQEHVQAADKLIAETGYKRRLPELWELQTLVGNADVP